MKIAGLTLPQLIGAIAIGLAITFAFTWASAPHLVEAPIQIMTPVPTPPPVIITQAPITTQTQVFYDRNLTDNTWSIVKGYNDLVFSPLTWFSSPVFMILLILMVMGSFAQTRNFAFFIFMASGFAWFFGVINLYQWIFLAITCAYFIIIPRAFSRRGDI